MFGASDILDSAVPMALSKEVSANYRPRMIGYRAPLGKNAFEFAIYGDDVSSLDRKTHGRIFGAQSATFIA